MSAAWVAAAVMLVVTSAEVEENGEDAIIFSALPHVMKRYWQAFAAVTPAWLGVALALNKRDVLWSWAVPTVCYGMALYAAIIYLFFVLWQEGSYRHGKRPHQQDLAWVNRLDDGMLDRLTNTFGFLTLAPLLGLIAVWIS